MSDKLMRIDLTPAEFDTLLGLKFRTPDESSQRKLQAILDKATVVGPYTLDESPSIVYSGRKFEFESGGTGIHTKVKIDGVEQKTLARMVVEINGPGFVHITTWFLDGNSQADFASDIKGSFPSSKEAGE